MEESGGELEYEEIELEELEDERKELCWGGGGGGAERA